MMLTQLAHVARRTGYPVVEVDGWKTRGRPGGMSDIRTITCHHTANGGAPGNYPSLRVVRDGRKGLPGPLAQYGIGVDGTIYVIAAGKCNHAGVSRSNDYLNSHAIGIEAEAEGTGDPDDWPPAQMESYQRLCRALVAEFGGVSVSDVRGHKETCAPAGRKSDPSFSMPAHRANVAKVNLATAPKELSMSSAEFTALKRALDAVPTASEIANALKPVIKAEVAAQLKLWQQSPVALGGMAGKELAKPDGSPATQHTAGDLVEWGAAHASAAHRISQEILDLLHEDNEPVPTEPGTPTP